MIKSKLVQSVYGKQRIIEHPVLGRLYVKRTNLRTYIVKDSQYGGLDSMVEFGGDYHFDTLKQLHAAMNEGQS